MTAHLLLALIVAALTVATARWRAARTGAQRATPARTSSDPTRIAMEDLGLRALDQHPDAAGIYFPLDVTFHCRACVADPIIRALIVSVHADDELATVLFGQSVEELVSKRCATHQHTT